MKKLVILITGLIFVSLNNSANATFVTGNFTINTNFIDTGGNLNFGVTAVDVVPTSVVSTIAGFDPDIYLQSIVRTAADAWEAVLPINQTFDINFGWGDITPLAFAGATGVDVNSVPISGSMVFNHNTLLDRGYSYYLDPTPSDNLEFSETRVWTTKLSGDTSNRDWIAGIRNTETGGFIETIPGLEDANGTNYTASPYWSDLYSTAVHEIGHALGLGSGLLTADHLASGHLIVSDWQYGGTELDLYHNGTSYRGHLADSGVGIPDLTTAQGALGLDNLDFSLMRNSGGVVNTRRHISDVDILAIGIMRGYSPVQLGILNADGTFGGYGGDIIPLPEPSSSLLLIFGSIMFFLLRIRTK